MCLTLRIIQTAHCEFCVSELLSSEEIKAIDEKMCIYMWQIIIVERF